MSLSTGQILHNRYRIVKLLGMGGFGAVYRAWDTTFSIPCAVKENLDISPGAQRQFMREAKMLRTLKHPNLPLVTDYFVIPEQGQYLVMDYVEGEDLFTKLEEVNAPLTETQVLSWIEQICDALTYLHSQSPPIIHRDIKPANIRITPDGKATLVDFGIAKVYDSQLQTTAGARAVTPGYSPLEQYGQGTTDARTDIYAMGATLYHLLTGVKPPESVERVTGDTLETPAMLNPGLSPGTVAAIMGAMQIQPGERYQSVAGFKGALSAPVLVSSARPQTSGLRTSTQPAPAPVVRTRVAQPPTAQAPPPAKRRTRPWIWIAVVAALGLGIVLMGAFLVWVMTGGGDGDGDLANTQTSFAIIAALSTTQSVPSPTIQATATPIASPTTQASDTLPSGGASTPTVPPPATHTPIPTSTSPDTGSSVTVGDPVQVIVDYWGYVSNGQYDRAWEILSPDFKKRMHANDFQNYVNGYQSKYCSIETGDVHLLQAEGNQAIVRAQVIYRVEPNCNVSAYDFEITLVFDVQNQRWLYDKTVIK